MCNRKKRICTFYVLWKKNVHNGHVLVRGINTERFHPPKKSSPFSCTLDAGARWCWRPLANLSKRHKFSAREEKKTGLLRFTDVITERSFNRTFSAFDMLIFLPHQRFSKRRNYKLEKSKLSINLPYVNSISRFISWIFYYLYLEYRWPAFRPPFPLLTFFKDDPWRTRNFSTW